MGTFEFAWREWSPPPAGRKARFVWERQKKMVKIGKTKISLPPPKEIAKYACYIFGLWAFVAGMFGALLSISVQMRRYKYRSLPQKFIGKFKYGDKADITYPTYSRGLYPWIDATCGTSCQNP